jgi:hypothetical protein
MADFQITEMYANLAPVKMGQGNFLYDRFTEDEHLLKRQVFKKPKFNVRRVVGS